ncbi:AAA family ATPase [Nannocystis radixulma]|uniref:AAA family ATPase n=1 Tax=Nannocystis radixulma TaxID=2995305 RepID=A0ABT5B3Y7_9BACT|nr:AAA family ATPase [Nannocystis radixulma]MDC0668820.1 AAA family ATPase [Nannocystis radixulma]
MRVHRLQLENFRGFAALDLDLSHGRTTALVGVNGSGKTSVLDALARLLALAVARTGLGEDATRLALSDVRAGASHCVVHGEFAWVPPPAGERELFSGDDGEQRFVLRHELSHRWDRWTHAQSDTPQTASWTQRWHDAWSRGVVLDAPLLATYSHERYVEGADGDARGELPANPASLYAEHNWSRGARRDDFLRWFLLREDFENELFRERRDHVDPQLAAVRRAILSFLPGYTDLRFRRRPTREAGAAHIDVVVGLRPALTLRKDGTQLAFSHLSGGEQGLLVLVGDIARRLAITHPNLADPLQGRGVVLIDEVELHLHPQWQRTLVPNLERTFPNLQFIVTTHSPQVLSLVPREQVKLLRDFQLVERPPHTLGRDSNAILYEVMGVDQYPPFSAEKVRTVARLIDEERWGEARAALAALVADFGPHDAEVVRLGSMMEFLAGDDDEASG